MTIQIKAKDGLRMIYNVTMIRKPLESEDTNYNFVCLDTFNTKRYFNELVMVRG